MLADTSSYYEGDGASVFPIENKNIVLKTEVVRIRPDPQGKSRIMATHAKMRWLATCQFVFYNRSESPEIVTMGYPDWLYNNFFGDYVYSQKLDKKTIAAINKYIESDKEAKQLWDDSLETASIAGYAKAYFKGYQEEKLPYVKEAWLIDDLKVTDGDNLVKTIHKPIGVTIKVEKRHEKEFAISAEAPLGAFVWKVKFKPNETKTTTVTFSFGGLNDIGGYQEVSYLLRTGALWADKIGKADIYWNFTGRGVDTNRIFPPGYRIKGNVIHWHFEDFKPDKDVTLFVGHGQ